MGKNSKRPSRLKAPATPQEPLVDIPKNEAWRIINETGILQQINKDKETTPAAVEDEEGKLSPLTEEIFNAINLIIPHSFLLLMMDMYVWS